MKISAEMIATETQRLMERHRFDPWTPEVEAEYQRQAPSPLSGSGAPSVTEMDLVLPEVEAIG